MPKAAPVSPKVMDRLLALIRQFDEEAKLCQDKIDDWTAFAAALATAKVAHVKMTISLWDQRRAEALEFADMLRELQQTCEARGMKPSPPAEPFGNLEAAMKAAQAEG